MRRVQIRPVIVLFALLVVVLFVFGNSYLQPLYLTEPEITPGEARLLWIVRDPEPVTFGNMLGAIPRNFGVMLSRAALYELPTAVLLDLWTMVFGHSLASLRAAGILVLAVGVWIIIAGLYLGNRLTRIVFGGMILVVVAVLAIIGPYVAGIIIIDFVTNYPLSAIIECYTLHRPLDEPVLIVFGGDTMLGYYDSRQNLRGGIAIDLSQRAYSSEELAAVVATLGEAPVWVMVDRPEWVQGDGTWEALQDVLLATGRVSTFQMENYQVFPDRNTSVIRYGFAPPRIRYVSCGRPISNQISGKVNLAGEAGMLTTCSIAVGVALVLRRRRINRRRAVGATDRETQEKH